MSTSVSFDMGDSFITAQVLNGGTSQAAKGYRTSAYTGTHPVPCDISNSKAIMR
jgi:hypothetical protein